MCISMFNASFKKGFTLIELLIAMSLFSLLATMGYTGLSNIISFQTAQEQSKQRKEDVEQALLIMSRDFYTIYPRAIRNNEGRFEAALTFDDNSSIIEFTRIGSITPYFSEDSALFRRSRFLRVGYQLEGDEFYRLYYPTLDRTLGTEAIKTLLLKGVADFEVQFLVQGSLKKFWSASIRNIRELPEGVEVKLTLKDDTEYVHFFPVVQPPVF